MEGAAFHCFLPAIEAEDENDVEDALACDAGGQMVMQATLDIPEPRNQRQAMEWPELGEWRKVEETRRLGMVKNCIYKQVARPKDKLVVGTKRRYKRKIGKDGKVEKYMCRLVSQGFWQVEDVHYAEKYSPTPATASIRMRLAMAAAKERELRHFNAEQAFLKAKIDEEIYNEIPEEFQEFPGAVGRLNKVVYGLVQSVRCWNNKFCDDMTAPGFEQAKTDPCVFRKVVDGEAEMVVVVHGCVGEGNAFKGGRIAESGGEGGNEEVPVPGGSGGDYEGGDDGTARHCLRRTRCDQALRKPWAGA